MNTVRTKPTKRCVLAVALLATIILFFFLPLRITKAAGETATIVIQGATAPPGFLPSFLTVHIYDTIVFVNHSSPPANYAVSASDGSFSSPAIAPDQQWKVAFTTIGVHEFYSVSAPQRMVGELLVVDNAVSLLPTAVPFVSATAIALIQAGHVPPDDLLMAAATPTSITKQAVKKTSATALPLYVPIALALMGVLLLSVLAYLLSRGRSHFMFHKRRSLTEEEDEDDMTLSEKKIPIRMGKEKNFVSGPATHSTGSGRAPLLRLRRIHVKDDEDDDE
jgi:plastocyanin